MTRSLQPAIQAVDKLSTPAVPSVDRLAYSYRKGYEDGHRHGSQQAYRNVGYVLALVALCGVVAWKVAG